MTNYTNMTNLQIIQGLDILVEFPDISNYIKSFNGNDGFMYTIETCPKRIQLKQQMEELLDTSGMHSGASWGYMLRHIQSVLNGVNKREDYCSRVCEVVIPQSDQ